jgi:hypothetical protein
MNMTATSTAKRVKGVETAEFKTPAPPPTHAERKAHAVKTLAAKPAAKAPKADKPKATKGQAVVDYYAKHPTATRAEVAKAVGCVVGRVGEVVRAGLLPDGVGVGRGGETKGQAILTWFEMNGPASRQACAEAIGCTVGRVGEMLRANADRFVKTDDGKWGIKTAKAAKPTRAHKAS